MDTGFDDFLDATTFTVASASSPPTESSPLWRGWPQAYTVDGARAADTQITFGSWAVDGADAVFFSESAHIRKHPQTAASPPWQVMAKSTLTPAMAYRPAARIS